MKLFKKNKKHECSGNISYGQWAPAITICYEEKNGSFWAENSEYASRVNFCPYCGAKAPRQGKIKYGYQSNSHN